MIRVILNEDEKKELEKLRKLSSSKNSEKALIVLLSNDGLSVQEIAEIVKRHPHTIRTCLKNYKKSDISGLSRKYSPGRPSIRTKELIPLILEWFQHSPREYGYIREIWTVKLIIDMFQKKTNLRISEDTVQRALKDDGYSYKRTKKTVPESAPSKEEKQKRVLEMLYEIEAFVKEKDAEIYILDESHFSTEPYIVKGWFKKKCATSDKYPQKTGKLHNIWCLEYKNTKILLEKFCEG